MHHENCCNLTFEVFFVSSDLGYQVSNMLLFLPLIIFELFPKLMQIFQFLAQLTCRPRKMCGAAQNNTCTKVKKTSQVLQGIQRADWLNHPELERERERKT